MSDDSALVVTLLVCVVLGMLAGMFVGIHIGEANIKRQVIEGRYSIESTVSTNVVTNAVYFAK